jgi:hypothetical protein
MPKKKESPVNAPDDKRRAFITKLPMAAAALMLSGSFGYPVESEQGKGQLYIKLSGQSNDGIFQLPSRDLSDLKSNKLGSLYYKLEISSDRKNWQTVSTQLTDRKVIDQLSKLAKTI